MKTIKSTKIKFPQFASYAYIGDFIEWDKNGYTIRAVLHDDSVTRPTDFDCYSPVKIKQWQNDAWAFCGVVLEVSLNGISLGEHCASLWGVDMNYNKRSNKYLSVVALELEAEALEYAENVRSAMLAKLQQ